MIAILQKGKRETPIQMLVRAEAGLELEPEATNLIQVSHMGDRDPLLKSSLLPLRICQVDAAELESLTSAVFLGTGQTGRGWLLSLS